MGASPNDRPRAHSTFISLPKLFSRSNNTTKPVVASGDGPNRSRDNEQVDIGPFAKEKHMPQWLVRVLKKGDRVVQKEVMDLNGEATVRRVEMRAVETAGLVDALARLSNADPNVRRACYCSPRVHCVAKMRREGSFCGYRNIQMLLSYVCNVGEPGRYQQLDDQFIPTVFLLQDMIEQAWDRGFNVSGRKELGDIRMTRKFIGTSEVEALFLSLEIPVVTHGFESKPDTKAYSLLLEHVLDYFDFTSESSMQPKVVTTVKPPIYLQRPGHSMTIIGVEEDIHGTPYLILFDPKYQPRKGLKKIALGAALPEKPAKLIKAHRYGVPDLAKYDAFEVVQFDSHPTHAT